MHLCNMIKNLGAMDLTNSTKLKACFSHPLTPPSFCSLTQKRQDVKHEIPLCNNFNYKFPDSKRLQPVKAAQAQ